MNGMIATQEQGIAFFMQSVPVYTCMCIGNLLGVRPLYGVIGCTQCTRCLPLGVGLAIVSSTTV